MRITIHGIHAILTQTPRKHHPRLKPWTLCIRRTSSAWICTDYDTIKDALLWLQAVVDAR